MHLSELPSDYDVCVKNGYIGAIYRINEGFIGSLLEQSIDDFSIETIMQNDFEDA